MDDAKHIAYWCAGAEKDLDVARELVQKGKLRQGLFFANLAVEKMLKAHVVKTTSQVPPRIRSFARLAELAALDIREDELGLLREFNLYEMEGRYPEAGFPPIDKATADSDTAHAAELLEWREKAVIEVVRAYLAAVPDFGIHPKRGVIYGSFARDEPHEWSDIDLVVVAPEFDKPYTIELVKRLWRATGIADDRIEPVACGEKEWETDDSRPILEFARREGIEVAV